MHHFQKNFGYIVLILVEIISYFALHVEDLEMFFMMWGLFYFALLIYNVFNVFADGSLNAVGGSLSGGASGAGKQVLDAKLAESLYSENKNDKREGGGLMDPSNMFFVFYTLINIIGYIIVMQK